MTPPAPQLRWSVTLPHPTFRPPIFLDDCVIVSVADQLRAFDGLTGAPRWTVELAAKCTIGRIIATADCVVACWSRPRQHVSDGAVAVAANGAITWQGELGAHERTLAATQDRVFVAGAH